MKPLKLFFLIFIISLFVFNDSIGQTIHRTVVGSVNSLDYGEGLGIVNGTYTYHFMYKLNKDGYIKSIHWNIVDANLTNDKGEKVKVIDSGHDNLGAFWEFWNTPTGSNAAAGYPEIVYDVPDGWLGPMMPAEFPSEGAFVNMNARLQVKNTKYRLGMLWIVNFNAKGDPVVDLIKVH